MLRFVAGLLALSVAAALVTGAVVVPLWLLARGVPAIYAGTIGFLVIVWAVRQRLHRQREAAEDQNR